MVQTWQPYITWHQDKNHKILTPQEGSDRLSHDVIGGKKQGAYKYKHHSLTGLQYLQDGVNPEVVIVGNKQDPGSEQARNECTHGHLL